MEKVYVIKDENHTWGMVRNKREVAPFIIYTGVLSITDSMDNDYDLIDLLECDDCEDDVIAHLENMSFHLQKIIFSQFYIYIEEEEIWSEEEYLHNRD